MACHTITHAAELFNNLACNKCLSGFTAREQRRSQSYSCARRPSLSVILCAVIHALRMPSDPPPMINKEQLVTHALADIGRSGRRKRRHNTSEPMPETWGHGQDLSQRLGQSNWLTTYLFISASNESLLFHSTLNRDKLVC